MNAQKVVTVFGSNDSEPGEAAYDVARQVGQVLGELGYAVANGGYGGTMEASAAGARQAGAHTIGVTCSIWRSKPNPHIREVVATTVMHERLLRLVELGTGGYVVLPGATGTLAELAWVWELMCKRQLERRPIACVGGFWEPLLAMMEAARPGSGEVIRLVAAPSELREVFVRA